MEDFSYVTNLSRLQFALTTAFHILWPLLSIGLSVFLVVLEALWLKTGRRIYYDHCRFWGKLFVLSFAVGVVSGIPLEFQFGTNWEGFSAATGGFFGTVLGFEGTMAFMLEAGFLGIMVFGWNRVSPPVHLFSTCMVALGASLSSFWIMVANSWMQTPAGGYMENGRFVLTSYWDAIFNPDWFWGFSHMWVACLEATLFVVGGISAWSVLKGRHPDFFLKSFKMAFAAALVVAPLQVFLGDGSGLAVAEHQPAKVAAIESHWETNPQGEGASWNIAAWPDRENQTNAWAVSIPNVLSLLLTHTFTGEVKGLREFPVDEHPPIVLPFYAFRVMVAIGFAFVFLMLWTLWVAYKEKLTLEALKARPKLLHAWAASVPLGFLAVEMGWISREVGRQPWIVYGMLRTDQAASRLPAGAVTLSLVGYAAVYTLLLVVFWKLARRIVVNGPSTDAPLPRQAFATKEESLHTA